MFRGLRFIAVGLAVSVFGGWLIAQRNPQAAPDTLEAIQETLKQLQAQVKSLQETVKRLSKDNKNGKNLALSSPALTRDAQAPARVSNFQKAQESYKQGQRLEEQKLSRPAIEAYSHAIEVDQRNDAALLHRGYAFYQLGEYASAASDFTKSLAIQPNNSRAYLARALSYAALGQNAEALADADEAILRDPKNPDSLLLRGRLNQQRNEVQKALADYSAAVSMAPGSELAYLGRAVALRAEGQVERSLADCDSAVKINPNSVSAYLCRAASYLKMDAPGPAVEQLSLAMLTAETLHQPLPLLQEVGQSLRSTGQPSVTPAPSAPAPQSEPAPALEPSPIPVAVIPAAPPVPVTRPRPANPDAGYYDRLGRARSDEEKFLDAVNLLNSAIEIDPTRATAFNARGYAHLRLLKFDLAVADFSEAIRLNPVYVNAYHNRAIALRRTGDRNAAAEDDRKATALASSATPPANRLAAQR